MPATLVVKMYVVYKAGCVRTGRCAQSPLRISPPSGHVGPLPMLLLLLLVTQVQTQLAALATTLIIRKGRGAKLAL